MLMEKLMSKRGQISMEIGILDAAAVAVAAVAAFFYINSVRQSAQDIGEAASNIVNKTKNRTEEIAGEIDKLLNVKGGEGEQSGGGQSGGGQG